MQRAFERFWANRPAPGARACRTTTSTASPRWPSGRRRALRHGLRADERAVPRRQLEPVRGRRCWVRSARAAAAGAVPPKATAAVAGVAPQQVYVEPFVLFNFGQVAHEAARGPTPPTSCPSTRTRSTWRARRQWWPTPRSRRARRRSPPGHRVRVDDRPRDARPAGRPARRRSCPLDDVGLRHAHRRPQPAGWPRRPHERRGVGRPGAPVPDGDHGHARAARIQPRPPGRWTSVLDALPLRAPVRLVAAQRGPPRRLAYPRGTRCRPMAPGWSPASAVSGSC